MLKIAPIGTCRIHTPFRRAAAQFEISPCHFRNYGFTHTSSEALQQLRFIHGEIEFDEDVAKLLFRPDAVIPKFKEMDEKPDIYFVEISSGKNIVIDDLAVQMNYTYRYFSEFFSDADRTRKFWSLASGNNREAQSEWLQQQPVFKKLNAKDRSMLDKMELTYQGKAEIARDMKKILGMIGAENLIFTTHVNALNPDDRKIASRDKLIQEVEAVADSLNVRCYNPTELMLGYGQSKAMEKGGLDLTHFTPAFSDILFADWNKRFFGLTIDDGVNAANGSEFGVISLTDIKNLIDNGEVIPASQNLRQTLRENPDLPEYRRVLAELEYTLGNYEESAAFLTEITVGIGGNEDYDTMLMVSSFHIGDFKRALKIGMSLLSDEIESDDILRISALSAMQEGRDDLALAHWKRLFYLEAEPCAAATEVLNLLQKNGNSLDAESFARETLDKYPDHQESLKYLWYVSLERDDREQLLELIGQSHQIGSDAILDILQKCVENNYQAIAASLVSQLPNVTRKDERLVKWVEGAVDEWLTKGIECLENDNLQAASNYLQGSWILRPKGNIAIRARRSLERNFRINTRAAFSDKDYDRVLELTAAARSTFTEFPEMDVYAGRACLETANYPAAITFLRAASEDSDSPLRVLQQLTRAAMLGEEYGEAILAFKQLKDSKLTSKEEALEAQARINKLTGRLIKAARIRIEGGKPREAWQLLESGEFIQGFEDQLSTERKRVTNSIVSKIRELDSEESQQRYRLGKLIHELDPRHEFGLKSAAIGAMRMHKFEESLKYWTAMKSLTKNGKQVDKNIEKCRMLLERESQ